MGSPWSPPPWMKTPADSRGGRLKPEFYAAYARYFIKYIEGMKAEGIRIDAITLQNREPLKSNSNPQPAECPPWNRRFLSTAILSDRLSDHAEGGCQDHHL